MRQYMLVVLTFCAAMGNAHATSVIAVREPTFLMFAADSKEVGRSGNASDDNAVCKISATNGVYWSASGMVENPSLGFSVSSLIAKSMASADTLQSRINAFSAAAIRPLTEIVTQQRLNSPAYYHRVYEVGRASILQVAFAAFYNGIPFLYVDDFRFTVDALTNKIVVTARTSLVPAPGYALLGYNEVIAMTLSKMNDWKAQIAIPKTMFALIGSEIYAHPKEVSMPIAIVALDKDGPHWISGGACGPK